MRGTDALGAVGDHVVFGLDAGVGEHLLQRAGVAHAAVGVEHLVPGHAHCAGQASATRLAEFLRQLRVAREPFAQMDLADPASGQAWQVIRERGFLRIGR